MVVLPKEINEIVREPFESFKENPVGILWVISFACEADFDLVGAVYDAAVKNVGLLKDVPIDEIRTEFEKIISSGKAGKGLQLLTQVGVMSFILGEDVAERMTKGEMEKYTTYVENIDKTKKTRLRRLGLFYMCFNNKKAERAIKRLHFTEEEESLLLDGIYLSDTLYFLTNKYDMKKFMVKHGMECYDFLNNLSKAQRIVYDLPINRIESRRYVLDNIREYKEPIFMEELAINKDDLRERGIGKEEDYDRVFTGLLDLTHIKPALNTKADLLEYAEKYSKHKWAAPLKKIRYIK